MEINLTRSERIIAIIAFVAISIFFVMFLQISRGAKSSSQFETGSVIDYTMARPDQAYSEYTLEGRELDHIYEGLESDKTDSKSDKNKKELIAKKTAEAKKKEEIKKKQAALVQAQAQAKLKEQVLAQQEKTQQTNENKNRSKVDSSVNTQNNSAYVAQNNSAPEKNAEVNGAKTNKKTFAEWRNLLFSYPTTENLGLFIAALRKNEVSATEYQAMAQDLIDQNDLKLKGLGLMALRSVPSLASLSQLAHLQPASLGNYQAYVEQSLNAYLQPHNLPYLSQALLTNNKILIAKSLNILGTNLAKFSQGDFSGLVDPRNRRDGEVTTFSMNDYRSLLPALNQLGSSQDQELKGLAQQVMALIQTSNNVAIN